jgi:hypothetical protein
MVDFQLKQQWKQSVYRAQRTGMDARGFPSGYGTAVEITPVRIQPIKRVVWAGTEKERTTDHDIFTITEFETTDRVWFFDQLTSTNHYKNPVEIKEMYDEFGVLDYYRVSL